MMVGAYVALGATRGGIAGSHDAAVPILPRKPRSLPKQTP
jgi:hypothetical protein